MVWKGAGWHHVYGVHIESLAAGSRAIRSTEGEKGDVVGLRLNHVSTCRFGYTQLPLGENLLAQRIVRF